MTTNASGLAENGEVSYYYGDYYYGDYDVDTVDTNEQMFLWMVAVFGGVVCLTGLIGNALTLATLLYSSLRKDDYSLYLIVLAMYDIFILLYGLLSISVDWIMGEWHPLSFNSAYSHFMSPASAILDPIFHVFVAGSVYVTMVLSIDRCIAVVFPFKKKTLLNRFRTKIIIVLASLVAVVINIPFYLEKKLGHEHNHYLNDTIIVPFQTEFSKDYFFQVIFSKGLHAVFVTFIPILVLVFTNVMIVKTVLFAKRNIRSTSNDDNTKAKVMDKLTYQVFAISTISIISRVLQAYAFIIEKGVEGNTDSIVMCSVHCASINALSTLFIEINSACNFVFYCLFGKRFRKQLKATVRCQNSSTRRNTESRLSGHTTFSTMSQTASTVSEATPTADVSRSTLAEVATSSVAELATSTTTETEAATSMVTKAPTWVSVTTSSGL